MESTRLATSRRRSVAIVPAERIVDAFEAVEIEIEECRSVSRRLPVFDAQRELFRELIVVGQARQRVDPAKPSSLVPSGQEQPNASSRVKSVRRDGCVSVAPSLIQVNGRNQIREPLLAIRCPNLVVTPPVGTIFKGPRLPRARRSPVTLTARTLVVR